MDSADRATRLTRQLLMFSRRQSQDLRPLQPNDVIASMRRMLLRLLGEDVRFNLELDDTGEVLADLSQLEQIVLNLVVNAREAMPHGGELTLETRTVWLAHHEIEQGTPGWYVRIRIRDTGEGMSSETVARVFEPFFTTKSEGTGLGLSTVYGIIKQNNGLVQVQSELGQGTTFDVFLPLIHNDFAPPPQPPKANPDSAKENQTTILLVEDDVLLQRVLSRQLKANGYAVLETTSPGDALLLCEHYKETIDLVISDVVMPHINGAELVKRVKLMRPDVRVLYISGYTANIIEPYGVQVDNVEFLQKPFKVDQLLQHVERALQSA